jgi:hypothetical protein
LLTEEIEMIKELAASKINWYDAISASIHEIISE